MTISLESRCDLYSHNKTITELIQWQTAGLSEWHLQNETV